MAVTGRRIRVLIADVTGADPSSRLRLG